MRTLDPQLLLPMRTSHQWHIKIGVALGLAAMLAVALPGMLIWILPPEAVRSSPITWQLLAPSFVLALAAVTVLSLYVSSLCSSGLWALMLSVPAALAVALFVGRLHRTMEGVLQSLVGTPDWRLVDRWAGFLTIAVILVVLRLALSNHRSADRSYWGTAAQVAIAAGAMTAAVAIAGLAGALSR